MHLFWNTSIALSCLCISHASHFYNYTILSYTVSTFFFSLGYYWKAIRCLIWWIHLVLAHMLFTNASVTVDKHTTSRSVLMNIQMSTKSQTQQNISEDSPTTNFFSLGYYWNTIRCSIWWIHLVLENVCSSHITNYLLPYTLLLPVMWTLERLQYLIHLLLFWFLKLIFNAFLFSALTLRPLV